MYCILISFIGCLMYYFSLRSHKSQNKKSIYFKLLIISLSLNMIFPNAVFQQKVKITFYPFSRVTAKSVFCQQLILATSHHSTPATPPTPTHLTRRMPTSVVILEPQVTQLLFHQPTITLEVPRLLNITAVLQLLLVFSILSKVFKN